MIDLIHTHAHTYIHTYTQAVNLSTLTSSLDCHREMWGLMKTLYKGNRKH